MIKSMTLALAALLLGALLQTAAFAQTPQIRDVTGNWIDDEPRVLKARMLPMLAATGVRIIRVDATFARHHWPGRDQAHRVTAVFDQASREWRANPVAGAARRGDSLFVACLSSGRFSIVGLRSISRSKLRWLYRRSAKVQLAARRRIRTLTCCCCSQ